MEEIGGVIGLVFGFGGMLTMLFTVIWMVKSSKKAEVDELYEITEQLRKDLGALDHRAQDIYLSKEAFQIYREGRTKKGKK